MRINRTMLKTILATTVICLWIDVCQFNQLNNDMKNTRQHFDEVYHKDSLNFEQRKNKNHLDSLNQDSL